MSADIGVYEPRTFQCFCLAQMLISDDVCQVIVNEDNAHATKEFLTKRLIAIKNQRKSGEQEDLALIIGTWYCLLMCDDHT